MEEKLGEKKQCRERVWIRSRRHIGTTGNISLRTLQTYREKGLLAYSCIKHKIFYKPEDVETLLKSSYHHQNQAK